MISGKHTSALVLAGMLAGGLGFAALRHAKGPAGGGCCSSSASAVVHDASTGDCCNQALGDRQTHECSMTEVARNKNSAAEGDEGYVCPLTGETLPCPNCCPLNK
jgi:hypothetical protein